MLWGKKYSRIEPHRPRRITDPARLAKCSAFKSETTRTVREKNFAGLCDVLMKYICIQIYISRPKREKGERRQEREKERERERRKKPDVTKIGLIGKSVKNNRFSTETWFFNNRVGFVLRLIFYHFHIITHLKLDKFNDLPQSSSFPKTC